MLPNTVGLSSLQNTGKLINSINLLLKVSKILDVFKTEQDHEHSPYTFVRDTTRKEDTLINDGRGAKQLLQE